MDDEDKMGDQLAQFETLRDAMIDKGVELKLRVVFMKRLFFTNVTTPIEHYDKTTLDLLFVQVDIVFQNTNNSSKIKPTSSRQQKISVLAVYLQPER